MRIKRGCGPVAVAWIAWAGLGLVACGEEEEAANQAPEFIGGEAELRTQVDTPVSLEVSARDPDGDAVTLSMIQGPETARFAAPDLLGRFYWAPIASDAAPGGKPHEVIFEAKDSRGGRATFRTVILVETSEGAPRFVTTNQRVLDLSRSGELRAEIRVKDDDSSRVELSLKDAPEGMVLEPFDDKSAELRWTPTERQIEKKLVWGTTVVADDGASGPVEQSLTVILITKSCGDAAAALQHVPLGEQRGVSDYAVTATVPGAGGAAPTLFWRRGGDPNDSGGFEGVMMVADGGDAFTGTIPNPILPEGKYDDIFYFIVGVGSGETGEVCTNRAPELGFYSFTAYPPGDTSCRQDSLEPNDTIAQARMLNTSSSNGFEGYNLSLCDGDRDLYAITLGEGQGASGLIVFREEDGLMELRALGPDGTTVLADSNNEYKDSASVLFAGTGAGTHYLEVSGARNGYSLFVVPRDNVDPECVDTRLEPNDSPRNAVVLEPGTYGDLKLCAGDNDYFAVTIPQGKTFTARATFRQAEGDIDLFLRNTSEEIAARATTTDDNEELTFTNDRPGASSFTLQVRDYDDNPKNYALELILEDSSGDVCAPDFLEPNNTSAEARQFPTEGGLDDFGASMCGDDDFYAFAATSGDAIDVTLTFDAESIDLDLAVFGPNDQQLGASEGIEGTERVQLTASTSGVYVARAYRYPGDTNTADYTIDLRVGGGNANNNTGPTCRAESSEPNDAIARADILEGEEALGLGACAGDTDWWALLGVEGGDLLLDLIPEDSSGGDPFADLTVQLYDSTGQQLLDTGVRAGSAISVETSSTAEDFYLVKVQNNSTTNFHNYRLEFLSL